MAAGRAESGFEGRAEYELLPDCRGRRGTAQGQEGQPEPAESADASERAIQAPACTL